MRQLLTPLSGVGLMFAVLVLSFSRTAQARDAIARSGQKPRYAFEVEPHGALGVFDPPGVGRSLGLGAGFRATVQIVKHGFIRKLDNSVGIGFGADYLSYENGNGARGSCERFVPAPNSTQVCVEVSGGGSRLSYVILPLVLQWNFWLTRRWSVYGEPGVLFYVSDGELEFSPIALYGGGRYRLSDTVALSLRLGYPTWSVGVSFLL